MSDELVKRLRERSSGQDEWFAMGREEKSYFISFSWELDAVRWMDDQKKRHAEWVEREGIHLVRQRVKSELETLAAQAADLIEQLQRDLAFQKEVTDAARQQQAELLERAEGLERDAARYRWLRRQAIAVRNYASGNPNWEIDWALRGESFDDAVDAALAQKEGS